MNANVIVVCGHCDSVVRIPTQRLAHTPRCPKCHNALFAGRALELDAARFERHLGRSELPLVVDFWAPWCGPCKMMAPAYEEAAHRLEPRARFVKVDSDQAPQLAARFGIRGIPTLIVFRHGREVARQAGALDLAGLLQWLSAHID